jgi:hypothetical protein
VCGCRHFPVFIDLASEYPTSLVARSDFRQ